MVRLIVGSSVRTAGRIGGRLEAGSDAWADLDVDHVLDAGLAVAAEFAKGRDSAVEAANAAARLAFELEGTGAGHAREARLESAGPGEPDRYDSAGDRPLRGPRHDTDTADPRVA